MTTRVQFALAAALVTFLLAPLNLRAAPPLHSVTGSGLVEEEGVVFRTDLAAFEEAGGTVWGSQTVYLDLSVFDLGIIVFRSQVTCLHVNGTSAWVGATVTATTNGDIIPIGTYTITLVRDLGGPGQDIMHGEPFDPSVDCASEPELTESVVISGNYRVR